MNSDALLLSSGLESNVPLMFLACHPLTAVRPVARGLAARLELLVPEHLQAKYALEKVHGFLQVPDLKHLRQRA